MNESLSREIVIIGAGLETKKSEEIPDQNVLDSKIISVIITEQITVTIRSLLLSNIIFQRR